MPKKSLTSYATLQSHCHILNECLVNVDRELQALLNYLFRGEKLIYFWASISEAALVLPDNFLIILKMFAHKVGLRIDENSTKLMVLTLRNTLKSSTTKQYVSIFTKGTTLSI